MYTPPAPLPRPSRRRFADAPTRSIFNPTRTAALVVEPIHFGGAGHDAAGYRQSRHHHARRRRHRERHRQHLGAGRLEPTRHHFGGIRNNQSFAGQRQPAEPVQMVRVADGGPDGEECGRSPASTMASGSSARVEITFRCEAVVPCSTMAAGVDGSIHRRGVGAPLRATPSLPCIRRWSRSCPGREDPSGPAVRLISPPRGRSAGSIGPLPDGG